MTTVDKMEDLAKSGERERLEMSKYQIPVAELMDRVSPLDGVKWASGPISPEDVLEAVQADVELEHRPWQEVNGQIPDHENRSYHIRRIITLMYTHDFGEDPVPGQRMRISFIFDDAVLRRVWVIEGNHRIAAAFFRNIDSLLVEVNSAYEDRIHELFPGAVLVEADPPDIQTQQDAPPEPPVEQFEQAVTQSHQPEQPPES